MTRTKKKRKRLNDMPLSKCERENQRLRKALEDIVKLFEEYKKTPISENQAAFIMMAQRAQKALKQRE
jgi:hypothetical protein